MGTIYRKTPKGIDEIETRAHRLAPRTRSALILVDGRRSDSDLGAMIPQGLDESLKALLDEGYIEAVAVPDAARPAPAASPRPVVPDLTPLRLEAARAVNDQTGPMGEPLAIKMERARSLDELEPLLALAVRLIADVRGKQAAADFQRRFIAG